MKKRLSPILISTVLFLLCAFLSIPSFLQEAEQGKKAYPFVHGTFTCGTRASDVLTLNSKNSEVKHFFISGHTGWVDTGTYKIESWTEDEVKIILTTNIFGCQEINYDRKKSLFYIMIENTSFCYKYNSSALTDMMQYETWMPIN